MYATRSTGSKPLQKLTAKSPVSRNSKDYPQQQREQQQKRSLQQKEQRQQQEKKVQKQQQKQSYQKQQQQKQEKIVQKQQKQQAQQQKQQQQQQHQHEQQTKKPNQATNVVKQKARNCSFWSYPAEVKTFENPRIKLDPTRFIYPGIVWGPNNQVIGMVDSTLFAIKLNR